LVHELDQDMWVWCTVFFKKMLQCTMIGIKYYVLHMI